MEGAGYKREYRGQGDDSELFKPWALYLEKLENVDLKPHRNTNTIIVHNYTNISYTGKGKLTETDYTQTLSPLLSHP